MPEKYDTAALLTLPQQLRKEGTSTIAAGIEVPVICQEPLPEGYEIIDLPPCKMIYFQGKPFENEDDYGEAIKVVKEAIAGYRPELYGYSFAYDLAPHFNYGAAAGTGARMAVAVKSFT
ncbi:MAG: hypothetical protein ACOX4N_09890 [Dethiobacteraceae bacterium]|nr:hypothetical protein [Bacillota bacterium]